ncbi:MAG: hypothetical protein PHC56_01730 [Herbinix sp.]|nr:hypothetical protein [Herbinix sp.]
MKKAKLVALLLGMTLLFAACDKKAAETNAGTDTWTVQETFTYEQIAKWGTMKTPVEGSGSGSVVETNTSDGFVTIKAADDGWGGVESGYIELDLEKEPMIFAQIFENPDGSKWAMKIVPENAIEDHEWGLYLIPDNNLKWNKYAGVDVKSVLDDDFTAIYGTKVKAKIWILAAGGPESIVSVSEIKIINTK